jgi:hypothetical protein
VTLAFPTVCRAAVFNQQDIARLSEINNAIQSLKQDITTTLKSLPSYEVERIQAYSFIEVSLEAAQERLNSIMMMVMISTVMESSSDQLRILNALYGELLPQSKAYVNAKQDSIMNIASAFPQDNMFVLYTGRAANILGAHALPLLDGLYQTLASIHRYVAEET